jgi:hypothetical protein
MQPGRNKEVSMRNPGRSTVVAAAVRGAMLACLLAWAACAVPCFGGDAAKVTVKELDGKVRVEIGGELFTEYVYKGYAKPILYPVIGPHDIAMTRNYPMKEVPGEARDHHHHKSLWYTHGSVNGVSFWHEGSGAGTIVHDKLLKAESEGDKAVVKTTNKWVDAKGNVVCRDVLQTTYSTVPGGRVIDFVITIHASEGDVVFGDTKEGTMGIRTHPNLRLRSDPRRGVKEVSGHAVNSEGVTGKAVWGKRAKWVDYWGTIDGKVVGVAIFDHPGNPRHPTWWHARDYGLIAANPFGVHNFEGKPRGTGDLKIPKGESRTWRYRFVFHEGDVKQAKVAKLYDTYAATKVSPAVGCCEGAIPNCGGTCGRHETAATDTAATATPTSAGGSCAGGTCPAFGAAGACPVGTAAGCPHAGAKK